MENSTNLFGNQFSKILRLKDSFIITYQRSTSAADSMDSMDNTNPWVELYKRAETIEYSGLVVTHLAADPGIVQHTLQITTIQYTIHHNITIHNGRHDGGDGAHHQHSGPGEEVRAHRHRRQHAHGPQVKEWVIPTQI